MKRPYGLPRPIPWHTINTVPELELALTGHPVDPKPFGRWIVAVEPGTNRLHFFHRDCHVGNGVRWKPHALHKQPDVTELTRRVNTKKLTPSFAICGIYPDVWFFRWETDGLRRYRYHWVGGHLLSEYRVPKEMTSFYRVDA